MSVEVSTSGILQLPSLFQVRTVCESHSSVIQEKHQKRVRTPKTSEKNKFHIENRFKVQLIHV